MKIKRIALFAAIAALAAALATPATAASQDAARLRDTTAHQPGNFDDDLFSAAQKEPERKATGFFFHHRDKRPAAVQFEEAGKKYLAGDLKGACRAYDRLVRSCPYSPEAPRAQYNLGAILERREKYKAAFDEYRYLLIYYPESSKTGVVLEHMFAIANWQLGRRKREAAAKSFAAIAIAAPGWHRAAEALFRLGEANFAMREWYDAADAFDSVASDYPSSEYALPAMERHAAALYALSLKYKEDEAIQNRAITVATAAAAALPKDDPARPKLVEHLEDLLDRRDARAFAIAKFYDGKRHKRESAIAAYEEFLRQYPRSPRAEEARARLEVLRAK